MPVVSSEDDETFFGGGGDQSTVWLRPRSREGMEPVTTTTG